MPALTLPYLAIPLFSAHQVSAFISPPERRTFDVPIHDAAIVAVAGKGPYSLVMALLSPSEY